MTSMRFGGFMYIIIVVGLFSVYDVVVGEDLTHTQRYQYTHGKEKLVWQQSPWATVPHLATTSPWHEIAYMLEKNAPMKKQLIYLSITLALSGTLASCDRSTRDNQADGQQKSENDSTYLESQDNNGQPTSDSDGGTVDETKGAPESGYGNANGTELAPSSSGSSGSASQRGTDSEKGKK
jgi:hypothetical protein